MDFQVHLPVHKRGKPIPAVSIRYQNSISTFVHELFCWTTANRSYQCHWEAAEEVPPKHPACSTEICVSLPGTHRHTPVALASLACCSQGYLKISVAFFLDLMTQWGTAGRAFLRRAEPGRSLTAAFWLEHMQLSDKRRLVPGSRPLLSAAEEPLGLTLNGHDLALGRAAGQHGGTVLFPLNQPFISSPRFCSHLIPQ